MSQILQNLLTGETQLFKIHPPSIYKLLVDNCFAKKSRIPGKA